MFKFFIAWKKKTPLEQFVENVCRKGTIVLVESNNFDNYRCPPPPQYLDEVYTI